MNAKRLACLALLSLALTACGKEQTPDKANAAGEILEGTASDAMLPLDTVKSQPPLAPRPTESARRGTASGSADAEASDAADADGEADGASPAAAPAAAEPAPE